jgi:hypothetical protein
MSSMGSMNATIYNNRQLLKNGKCVSFTKMNRGSSKKRNYQKYVMPWIFPHVLRRVRIKTKREKRSLLMKRIIIGTLACLVLLFWFYSIQYR